MKKVISISLISIFLLAGCSGTKEKTVVSNTDKETITATSETEFTIEEKDLVADDRVLVKEGMTENEVLRLLGKPFKTWDNKSQAIQNILKDIVSGYDAQIAIAKVTDSESVIYEDSKNKTTQLIDENNFKALHYNLTFSTKNDASFFVWISNKTGKVMTVSDRAPIDKNGNYIK